ncbi:ligand-binding protein SH3 [Actinotignum sanguinis]|uniref:DMT family transporter n=1 Tax=Actinotignum sanguinis TaxID=1445614 RepID=UPI000F7D7005|nr:multidrug efflux SMR transporter [Actinotignum sanguinis]MDY5147961.1 multidrug efflux SMR transporter [Actinotignum sanguinis]RTE47936.1 ligand-binding protein SH3 [Actinotignum sanguinis]
MAWAILVGSGIFEAVWATALGDSRGLTRPVPALVFACALVVSMWGLSRALREIPLGTAYAVWTGTGAVLTVAIAAARGVEQLSVLKAVFLCGIIGAVVGLRLVERREERGGKTPEN